jgi:hypothetical protein
MDIFYEECEIIGFIILRSWRGRHAPLHKEPYKRSMRNRVNWAGEEPRESEDLWTIVFVGIQDGIYTDIKCERVSSVYLSVFKSQSMEGKEGNSWQASTKSHWCTCSPGREFSACWWGRWGTRKTGSLRTSWYTYFAIHLNDLKCCFCIHWNVHMPFSIFC